MMKVFAGTYQGNVFILEGSPNALKIKSIQPVSDNSIRSMTIVDGQLLVGGYDQEIRALSVASGVETKESKDSKGVINIIRFVSEKEVVLGLDDGTIRFWDIYSWTSRKDIREHKKAVADIRMDKKGMIMVTAGGKQLIFWNLSSHKSLYHFRYDYEIDHVFLDQKFQNIFLVSNKTVKQIETQNNQQKHVFSLNSKIQCGLVFQNYLLLATQQGQIFTYSHGHYEHCIHFKAHESRIKDIKKVTWQELDYLVTADSNGVIRIWDILQFLKEVESISQQYNLDELKPLSSIETKQRIICIQAAGSVSQNQKKDSNDEKMKEKVEQQSQKQERSKQKKKKNIQKANKKGNKKKMH